MIGISTALAAKTTFEAEKALANRAAPGNIIRVHHFLYRGATMLPYL
jgi:hypothetical protein